MIIYLIIQGLFFGLMGLLSILSPLVMFTTAGPELLGLLRLVGFSYLSMMMVTLYALKQKQHSIILRFASTIFTFFNMAYTLAHTINALSFGMTLYPAIIHAAMVISLFILVPRND